MPRKERQNVQHGILKVLKKRKDVSYTELQNALSTNYLSVRENCKDLENYGLIKIETAQKHERNGHSYSKINLTSNGVEAEKKVEESEK